MIINGNKVEPASLIHHKGEVPDQVRAAGVDWSPIEIEWKKKDEASWIKPDDYLKSLSAGGALATGQLAVVHFSNTTDASGLAGTLANNTYVPMGEATAKEIAERAMPLLHNPYTQAIVVGTSAGAVTWGVVSPLPISRRWKIVAIVLVAVAAFLLALLLRSTTDQDEESQTAAHGHEFSSQIASHL